MSLWLMTDIEKRLELDSIDIKEPEGLAGLIRLLFGTDNKAGTFRLPNLSAPLFVYRENLVRNQYGLIDRESRIEYHVVNGDGKGVVHYSIDRDILRINGTSIYDTDRGAILVAFCKIEFILNSILFYVEGIYDNACSYESFYAKNMKDGDSQFHTFENKKKYLRLKKLIEKDTAGYLQDAQRIRNHIAHAYFLEANVGLDFGKKSSYRNTAEAVETIYNKCWLLLVRDYNSLQVKILSTLANNK